MPRPCRTCRRTHCGRRSPGERAVSAFEAGDTAEVDFAFLPPLPGKTRLIDMTFQPLSIPSSRNRTSESRSGRGIARGRQPVGGRCVYLGSLEDERTVSLERVKRSFQQGVPVLLRCGDFERKGFRIFRQRRLQTRPASCTSARFSWAQSAFRKLCEHLAELLGSIEEIVGSPLCIFLYRPDFSASSLRSCSLSSVSAAAPIGFLGVNRFPRVVIIVGFDPSMKFAQRRERAFHVPVAVGTRVTLRTERIAGGSSTVPETLDLYRVIGRESLQILVGGALDLVQPAGLDVGQETMIPMATTAPSQDART